MPFPPREAHASVRPLYAVAKTLYVASHLLHDAQRTRSLELARLMLLARVRPGPGRVRFGSGRLEFVAGRQLWVMYRDIFVEKQYELSTVREGGLILDCGGNIGLSALWFKRRYPTSRVVVYEADPAIARVLARNVAEFGLSGVEVVAAAVSDTNEPVAFAPDGGWAGRIADHGDAVPGVRLSDRIDGEVDLLKLDIEGSEYRVLADLCRTRKIGLVKHLVAELHCHADDPTPLHELWANLAAAGFRLVLGASYVTAAAPGAMRPPFPKTPGQSYFPLLYAWRA
jgi:FkbM family methyltransferase